MDYLTMFVGIALIGLGVYIIYAKKHKPSQLGKYEPMKQAWGDKSGSVIHSVAYSVIPIVLGVSLIMAGINGASLADILSNVK